MPDKDITNAIVFGCTKYNKDSVVAQLKKLDTDRFHPMVLPMVFAELERERMINMVRRNVTQLYEKVIAGQKMPQAGRNYDKEITMLWLKMQHDLESWKQQLLNLQSHTLELTGSFQLDDAAAGQGERIGERIGEMIQEYAQSIRSCTMVLNGLSLTTQFVSLPARHWPGRPYPDGSVPRIYIIRSPLTCVCV
jgi:hypothetical protein